MKYCIVCLLKGDVKKFHTKLRSDVARKFDVPLALKSKTPSHITLKYSFQANVKQLNELKKSIEQISINESNAKLKIDNYSHFRKEVIFVKIKPSKDMKTLQSLLIKELKKLKWMTWHEHDGEDMKFHATIARHDINDKFDEIFKYVNKFKPKFESNFDNITILRKEGEIWKIYKEYKLKLIPKT